MMPEDHSGGPVHCEQLGPFVDGELDAPEAAAFRRHLVECARCQQEMHGLMQLSALAEQARGQQPAPTPEHAPLAVAAGDRRPRPRRTAWMGALGVAALAAALVLAFGTRRQQPSPPDLLARLDSRPVEGWFSAFEGHTYRPYSVSRGTSATGVAPLDEAARLAAARRWRDLGALYALHGEWTRAEEALEKAPPGPERSNDLGLVKFGQGSSEEALRHFDEAVGARPDWALATFNRGLVLAQLSLGTAAAEDFQTAAVASTAGWADEATRRRRFAEEQSAEAQESWRQMGGAMIAQIEQGTAWPQALARTYPDLARYALLAAVAVAPGPAQVAALRSQATALDSGGALPRLTDRLGNRFPPGRAEVAARLRALVLDRTLRLPERGRAGLVDGVLAVGEADQVVFVLNWLDVGAAHAQAFADAAARLGDPFWLLEAERNRASDEMQRGDVLSAERRLRVAFSGCDTHRVPSQCALLGETLGEIYLGLRDLEAARATVSRALEIARSGTLYLVENKLTGLRAEIEVRAARFALAAAYGRQQALRPPKICDRTSELQTLAARTRLGLGSAEAARADIAAAYGCERTVPDPARPAVVMDLLESGALRRDQLLEGNKTAEALLQEDLAALRAEPGEPLRALADAIEGRLELLSGHPEQALRLAERGLAIAASLTESEEAEEARSTLRLVSAFALAQLARPEGALDALVAQLGARTPSECVLGAAETLGQRLWIARGAGGAMRSTLVPRSGGEATVPPPLVALLQGCPRVSVVTSASLQSHAGLLPLEVAWSYLGPGERRTAAPGQGHRGVLVTSPTPPRELALPPLAPVSPPAPGGWVVLTGAAATPARVVSELPEADYVDFQVHGFVDPLVPDAARLALSQDSDGSYALTARALRGLRLNRAPVVALGACHSAQGSVLHPAPWSLPLAFLRAGASAVIASPADLPDGETPRFFSEVRERMGAGADPEIALRDARLHWTHELKRPWVKDVVLFRGN